MKKLITLLVAVFLTAATAEAKERTQKQIMEAARHALAAMSVQTRAGSNHGAAEKELKILSEKQGTTIVGYAEGGFAVVANDDMYKAVIGLSETEYTEGVANFEWWRDMMEASMAAGQTRTATYTIPAGLKQEVAAMVKTKWTQEYPYNMMCPDESVTGCVATAMAQIMNYHKYPNYGKGTATYTHPTTKQPVTLNLNGLGTYDWDNMANSYTLSTTDRQKNAVAKLMYHCGAAVGMAYGRNVSGAFDHKACTALYDNFGYGTSFHMRDYYSTTEWLDMVYSDLSSGNPIMYGGESSDGQTSSGHAFVIDGYSADGLVHVNWGWGGYLDGHYDIALLNPVGGGVSYSFQYNQDMVRISPDESVKRSVWEIDTYKASYTGSIFSVNEMVAYNIEAHPFAGAIKMIVEGEGRKNEIDIDEYFNSLENVDFTSGWGIRNVEVDLSNFPNGTYNIYPASKAVGETEWQPMRATEGEIRVYKITMNNGRITGSIASGVITGIEQVTAGSDGTTRVYDTTGRMVYSAPTTSFSTADIPATGILIIKDGGQTRKIVK